MLFRSPRNRRGVAILDKNLILRYSASMTIYFIAVVAIFGLVAVVIFHEVVNAKNKFEESAQRKEILELFVQGFRQGLDVEGKNVDLFLKRLGYNGPEMTQEILNQKEQTDIPAVGEEAFVPEHEREFDLEQAELEEGAQWVGQEQGMFPMLDLDPGLQGPKE